MSVIRVKHSRNFTTIANEVIRDNRLTLKARGLHHLLLSYPHNWEISIKGLVADCLEGEAAIRTAIAELIEHGYIRRVFERSSKGCFQAWDFEVYEQPLPPDPEKTSAPNFQPDRDYPVVDNPVVDNRVHTNKDLTNTVFTNTLSSPTPSQLESQAERENFDEIPKAETLETESGDSDSQGEDLSVKAKAIGEDNFSAPAPQPKISSFANSNFESAGTIAQSLATGQNQTSASPQIVTVTVESKDEDGNKATSNIQIDITAPDYRTWIVGYCIRKMPDQPERDSLNEDLLVSSLARKPETQRRYVQHCQKLAERAEIERLAPIQPVYPPPAKFATIGSKCAMLQAKWMLPRCRNAAIAQAQELGFDVTDEGIALPAYADPETLLDKWEAF